VGLGRNWKGIRGEVSTGSGELPVRISVRLRIVPSKNALASQRIATDLLGRAPGERLPTALQYQEQLGVGSGTVQKALRELADLGAVRTQARGHQGTYVVELRVDRLWAIAGLGPMTGVMPLPNSAEWAGLATGLRSEFGRLGIPLQALYVHGSYRRAELVAHGGADFAVLSREAASYASARSRRWTTLDFGPRTYYSDGSLVVLLRPGIGGTNAGVPRVGGERAIRRVGIDSGSYDHTELTKAEFPEEAGFEYAECAYPHIPAAVAEGRVDAAVWNRTMLAIPLELVGVTVGRLRRTESVALSRALGHAVLLNNGVRPEVASVLRRIDREALREVQGRVISQEILPMY
jgi:hypothetical protein